MSVDQATDQLLARYRAGDRAVVEPLLARYRDRMRRFLELRMDRALRARIDPSDVIQEAQIELARRLDDYLRREPMPFHVWVCKTSLENLLRLRRSHVDADCRAVAREQALPDESSMLLVAAMRGPGATPLDALVRDELVARVGQAVEQLADVDREVVLLRTFEGLSNQEVAQVLEIEPDAASKRYGRALLRLRQALARLDEPGPP